MSYNPYGGKYTYGGSLKHSRTKGSKNGVSNNPNYKPIGQKAVGVIVGRRPDGTPIYSYGPQSAGQKARNTQALQNAVSGQQQNRSRNTEALRQRVGTKAALDARAINSNKGVVARREQRNRIDAATATNAGSRGISSREEAQRQGSRINANQYGNTFGNRVGRTADSLRAKGNRAVTETKKAVKNAPETITKAAKDTRNIFQRGASAIGNWFNQRRAELKTTGKNVGNWLSDRGRDIGRAAKSAYEAVSNSDERKAYEKAQANFRKNPTAENRRARDAAKKAYDSHLLTRLDRGVKGAPGNISRTARNAAGTVKRGAEAVGRAVSNQDELNAYKEALKREKANPTTENKRATREARDAYNNHVLTKASGTARQAGRSISSGARKAGEAATKLGGQLMTQVKSLPQNIQKKYSKAVADAQKLISEAPGQAEAALTDIQDQINWEIEQQKKKQQQKTLDSMFK